MGASSHKPVCSVMANRYHWSRDEGSDPVCCACALQVRLGGLLCPHLPSALLCLGSGWLPRQAQIRRGASKAAGILHSACWQKCGQCRSATWQPTRTQWPVNRKCLLLVKVMRTRPPHSPTYTPKTPTTHHSTVPPHCTLPRPHSSTPSPPHPPCAGHLDRLPAPRPMHCLHPSRPEPGPAQLPALIPAGLGCQWWRRASGGAGAAAN